MLEKREAVASHADAIRDEPATSTAARARRTPPGPRYHAVVTAPDGAKSLHALAAYADDEAIAHALVLAAGRVIEIWDGPRLIQQFSSAR